MNWDEAPEIKWGRNPKSPIDFPFESEDQKRIAAQNALSIMKSERGDSADPAALEREITRTSAIAGPEANVNPTPAAAAPKGMSWDSAPEVQVPQATAANETWNQAPEVKASWWDAIKAIPGNVVGQMQETIGGYLQGLAEEPPAPPFGSGVTPQEYENQDSTHIKYIAKKQGIEPAQVIENIRKDREQSPLALKGAEIYKKGEETIKESTPANLDWWQQAVVSGASNVVTQVPALAASILTRSAGPSLAAAGAMQYGQSYGEKREAGMPSDTAAGSSAIDAAAEVLFEIMPTKFLVHHAGGPVLSTIAGTMLREVPMEVATTAVQSANAMLSHKPDMTWEEYGQSLLDTVGATMVSAPLLGGAGKVLSPLGRGSAPAQEAPPSPTLQAWQDNPIAVMSQATDLGLVNGELTGPNIDEPTVSLDSGQEAKQRADLNAIDPESISEKDLDEARKIVDDFKKSQKAPPLPGAEAAWTQVATAPASPVEDIGELGASTKQAANAVNYINPNQGDRLDRPITYGPEGYEGLTPRQVAPKPGTYTLGVPTDDRPSDYLRALHDTVEQWRQEYLPNDTIVLSNEQLFSNSALGWHYSTDQNSHLIVPAVLRKPSRGLGQYNPNTQASAFYNATHEFGHALITSKFYEGMTAASQVRDESRQGLVTSLQGIPAPQAAVIQEFNALKEQILSGQMNAEQFIQRWMNPAKVGKANFLKDLKVAPEAPAMQVVNAIIKRATVNSNIRDEMSQTALRQRLKEDYLSLDEYLAEQVARHAYQKQWDKSSPLGQFFSRALDGLRNFFVKTKKDGIIAPGVAFQEWLDGIGKAGRAVDEVGTTVGNKKRAGKKTPTSKKSAKPAGTKKSKVTRVAHNVQSDTFEREKRKAFKSIDFLEKSGTIDSTAAKEMRGLVESAAWDDFVEAFQKHAVKSVKFEWSGENSVNDFRDWKDGKFDSPSFRAWFGDWTGDPENSSVVRTGAFVQKEDGTLAVDRRREAPPLVLFASRERLLSGENVFQASSLRGAHYAEAQHPVPLRDGTMVPVVLNIRNPYIVQDFVSPAPDRASLSQQGFDGIVYQNDMEGHTSFIVFNPAQVKVVPERNPYPRGSGVHLELDHDQASPAGEGAGRLFNAVKNFVNEPGPIRRSLRYVQGWSRHVLQLQQLSHVNPDLTDLTYLVNTNTEYARYGASRRVDADRILNEWKSSGKESFTKIGRFLTAEKQGGVNWFSLTKAEKNREGQRVPWWRFELSTTAQERLKEYGIDVDTERGRELAAQVLAIKNNLLDYLNEDEQVLQEILGHRYGHSQAVLNSSVKVLKAHVHSLRQTPFFPEGRFGNFILTISQKKASGPGYEIVHREAFESRAKWEAAWKRAAQKATTDQKVSKHEVSDSQYVLMSLPTDFVDLASSELGLTETQVDSLTQLLQPVKQEKLLSQYDLKKFGFKNTDPMRSYANFTWHHSNAQAKLLYRRKFNLAITNMRQRLRTAELDTKPQSFNEVGRLTRVVRAMETMRDYVMSPPNEMQNARAVVSIGYLALNVKTALVNFYGLATNWADLTTKYGAVNGERRFIRASYYAASSMRLTNLNDRKKGNYLPPDVQRGLDRAIEEGVLSQSYAYHLAGMANQNALARLPFYEYSGQITQKVVDLGMYPFRLVELATRRISFIAALEQHLEDKSLGFEEAYEKAVSDTNKLQNDYSLGNRMPLMRGGALGLGPVVPLATIFGSFAQHMAFHGWGGYELGQRREKALLVKEGKLSAEHDPKWYQWGYGYTARIWLLTMLLAGYEGLPGAENFIDILEAIWRRIGKKPLRQELREMIQALDQDPVQWSRGLGANVAGFDVSRSLGFGRVFPGTDVAARSADQDPEKAVGAATLDMLGPLGGFIKFGLEALSAMTSQKTWKDAAKKLPGGVGNLVNAYIWSQEGVKGPNGGLITLERTADGKLAPRDLTGAEIAGKALGFNPEIVARNREIMFATYDRKMYWQSKRVELLKSYVRARDEGDREAIADTKQAITDFNLDVPTEDWSKHFKITGKDIGDAMKRHRQGQKLEERGLPKERRYRGMAEDIRRSYETPSGGTEGN